MGLRKIVSWVLLSLILFVALAGFLFYLDLKKRIITRLTIETEKALGQKVTIRDISLQLPAIAVLHEVVIRNPEGAAPGELLRIRRLILNIQLIDLFTQGKLKLKNIIAQSPQLNLVRDDRNHWNVSDRLIGFLSRTPSSGGELQIDQLQIDSGRLTLNNDKRYTANPIHLSLRNLTSGAGEKAQLKGSLEYSGNRVHFEGWIEPGGKPLRVNLQIISKDFVLVPFQPFLEGAKIDARKARLNLRLGLEGDTKKGFWIRSNIEQADGGKIFPSLPALRNIRLQANIFFRPSEGSMDLDSATLHGDGFAATMAGTLTGLLEDPFYQLRVQIDRLDLSKLGAPEGFKMSGILTSKDFQMKGRLKDERPQGAGTLRMSDGRIEFHQTIMAGINADIHFSLVRNLAIKGDLLARIAKTGKPFPDIFAGRDVSLRGAGTFRPDEDILIIDSAALRSPGISSRLRAVMTHVGQNPSYQAELAIDEMDLSKFQIFKEIELNGVLTSKNLKVQGELKAGLPKVSGTLELREAEINSPQAHAEKIDASVALQFPEEIAIKGEATAKVSKVGPYPLDPPAQAKLTGSLQGKPPLMAIASALDISPGEIKLRGNRALSLGNVVLAMEGKIEGSSFIGNHRLEIRDLRYGGHGFERASITSTIALQKEEIVFDNFNLETEDVSATAAHIRAGGIGGGSLRHIDIEALNVTSQKGVFTITQGDARCAVHLEAKPLSGDLGFSATALSIHGMSSRRLSGSASFDERDFSLRIPRAELSGGEIGLVVQGRTTEGPFPMKVSAHATGVDLGSLSEEVRGFVEVPYRLGGKIQELHYEGVVNGPESMEGRLTAEAKGISVSYRGAERRLIKDSAIRTTVHFRDRDLDLDAEATLEKLVTKISGSIAGFMKKERWIHLAITLPDAPASHIREAFWDIFPDSLLYVDMEGMISSTVNVDHNDHGLEIRGDISLKDVRLTGEYGEYFVGPIRGSLPIQYVKQKEGHALPLPSFEKSEFDRLLRDLGEEPGGGSRTITIGAFHYGFPLLEGIRLRVQGGDNLLNVSGFDANIFNGRVYGLGTIDYLKGVTYRGGLLVKGLSLKALCDQIKPIQGFISGKVDGIASFKGTGTSILQIIGRSNFWADPRGDEKMMISKEFLQKIGGPSMKVYLGNRAFDKAVMDVYLKNGYLIFRDLEISNRNLLGITDLSIKAAPISNRIAFDHLLWTITEAAARAKEKK
jgi:hypothetical protein